MGNSNSRNSINNIHIIMLESWWCTRSSNSLNCNNIPAVLFQTANGWSNQQLRTWHQSPNSRDMAVVLSAFKSLIMGSHLPSSVHYPYSWQVPCVVVCCPLAEPIRDFILSTVAFTPGISRKLGGEGGKTVPKESSNYRVPIKTGFVKKEENLALPCLSPRFIPICRWVETPSDHLNTSEHLV